MQAPAWLAQIVAVVRSLSFKKASGVSSAQVSQAKAGRHALRGRPLCVVYRIACLLPNTGGTKGYDYPLYLYLVHPGRYRAHPLPNVLYLVPLASDHAQVTLCLVLAITPSYAMVSAKLVLDDLPAP